MTFLLLLSKGWKISMQSLRCIEILKILITTFVINFFYIAYYSALIVQFMPFFFNFMLTLLYLILFTIVLKQTISTLEIIKDLVLLERAGGNAVFLPCLTLKGIIMKRYMLAVLFYFFYEIVINGIIPLVSQILNWDTITQNINMDPKPALRQHLFDLVLIMAILAIFRPRNWPQFFHTRLILE